MAIRIQLRRNTAAVWISKDPVLLQGEFGLEVDTLKIKLGDGTTAWHLLPYYIDNGVLGDYVLKATTVNGHALSSNVSVTATDVGLSNVDNTSDVNKPVSIAQQAALDLKVDENITITGATKTKITYDAKGLVTAGADATTADIADSSNKRYVTDAELAVVSNVSGVNSGDETHTTIKTKLGAANVSVDGYLTAVDWNVFHNSAMGSWVPTYRTVNGHGLSTNVSVTAYDVGLGAVSNVDTTVTSNITDTTDRRFITDAELALVANLHKGSASPLAGSNTVVISGLALSSIPTQIFITENVPAGYDNIPYVVVGSSRSTDGFTIALDASLPVYGYQFDWMLFT